MLPRPTLLFVASMLSGCLAISAAQAQSQALLINGVEYREITDLNRPRVATAQPQLGAPVRLAQYAPSNTVWPATAPSLPADRRPVLGAAGQPIGQPVGPALATYQQPYAYGYGYANGSSWASPAGYSNRVPATGYPVSQTRPLPPTQPYGAVMPLAFTNVQPASNTVFNPYQQPSQHVPLRPIVSIRRMPENYEVGQGIIGQPKVYVPGQPVRNLIRYITP